MLLNGILDLSHRVWWRAPMGDLVAACAKRYQVAYGVYSVFPSDSSQRCHVVDMNEFGADCAVLIFVAR